MEDDTLNKNYSGTMGNNKYHYKERMLLLEQKLKEKKWGPKITP